MDNNAALAVLERLKKNSPVRDDSDVKVWFSYNGVKDIDKSTELGRPVYKMVEEITLRYPNGREIVLQATPHHIAQHPEAYERFKNQEAKPDDGTMLKEWSLLPRNVMCELVDLGVRTVEELSVCESIPQIANYYADWIDSAKKWLESSKTPQNVVTGLKKKIIELEKTVADLQDKNLVLTRQLQGN